METYFLLRSRLPVEEKEPAPCTGSNTIFLIFLSRSSSPATTMIVITKHQFPLHNQIPVQSGHQASHGIKAQ
ncbi:hypothetical protein EYF80_008075 [Liparis tanakae]|uniref:Uncharacterized protein n=1 Tax=Liparis tanakae TaxID=230148 RepID=A0A4Z2IUE5_9TELE|nr:hypothetical protein EYF80_008075 [Liparis tanakae]